MSRKPAESRELHRARPGPAPAPDVGWPAGKGNARRRGSRLPARPPGAAGSPQPLPPFRSTPPNQTLPVTQVVHLVSGVRHTTRTCSSCSSRAAHTIHHCTSRITHPGARASADRPARAAGAQHSPHRDCGCAGAAPTKRSLETRRAAQGRADTCAQQIPAPSRDAFGPCPEQAQGQVESRPCCTLTPYFSAIEEELLAACTRGMLSRRPTALAPTACRPLAPPCFFISQQEPTEGDEEHRDGGGETGGVGCGGANGGCAEGGWLQRGREPSKRRLQLRPSLRSTDLIARLEAAISEAAAAGVASRLIPTAPSTPLTPLAGTRTASFTATAVGCAAADAIDQMMTSAREKNERQSKLQRGATEQPKTGKNRIHRDNNDRTKSKVTRKENEKREKSAREKVDPWNSVQPIASRLHIDLINNRSNNIERSIGDRKKAGSTTWRSASYSSFVEKANEKPQKSAKTKCVKECFKALSPGKRTPSPVPAPALPVARKPDISLAGTVLSSRADAGEDSPPPGSRSLPQDDSVSSTVAPQATSLNGENALWSSPSDQWYSVPRTTSKSGSNDTALAASASAESMDESSAFPVWALTRRRPAASPMTYPLSTSAACVAHPSLLHVPTHTEVPAVQTTADLVCSFSQVSFSTAGSVGVAVSPSSRSVATEAPSTVRTGDVLPSTQCTKRLSPASSPEKNIYVRILTPQSQSTFHKSVSIHADSSFLACKVSNESFSNSQNDGFSNKSEECISEKKIIPASYVKKYREAILIQKKSRSPSSTSFNSTSSVSANVSSFPKNISEEMASGSVLLLEDMTNNKRGNEERAVVLQPAPAEEIVQAKSLLPPTTLDVVKTTSDTSVTSSASTVVAVHISDHSTSESSFRESGEKASGVVQCLSGSRFFQECDAVESACEVVPEIRKPLVNQNQIAESRSDAVHLANTGISIGASELRSPRKNTALYEEVTTPSNFVHELLEQTHSKILFSGEFREDYPTGARTELRSLKASQTGLSSRGCPDAFSLASPRISVARLSVPVSVAPILCSGGGSVGALCPPTPLLSPPLPADITTHITRVHCEADKIVPDVSKSVEELQNAAYVFVSGTVRESYIKKTSQETEEEKVEEEKSSLEYRLLDTIHKNYEIMTDIPERIEKFEKKITQMSERVDLKVETPWSLESKEPPIEMQDSEEETEGEDKVTIALRGVTGEESPPTSTHEALLAVEKALACSAESPGVRSAEHKQPPLPSPAPARLLKSAVLRYLGLERWWSRSGGDEAHRPPTAPPTASPKPRPVSPPHAASSTGSSSKSSLSSASSNGSRHQRKWRRGRDRRGVALLSVVSSSSSDSSLNVCFALESTAVERRIPAQEQGHATKRPECTAEAIVSAAASVVTVPLRGIATPKDGVEGTAKGFSLTGLQWKEEVDDTKGTLLSTLSHNDDKISSLSVTDSVTISAVRPVRPDYLRGPLAPSHRPPAPRLPRTRSCRAPEAEAPRGGGKGRRACTCRARYGRTRPIDRKRHHQG